ncbi:MAG: hypothetical protein WC334_04180 [Kiritimatiellales bacterium]|jgi:hypothetical protein
MCHHSSRSAKWVIVLLTATSLNSHQLSAQAPDTPPATPAQEQPEVLSRGPVHEAFAEPVTMQLQTGVVAPQQPPSNINEVPPAERPQGAQFVWIPGYWAWDADRNGYIWVSACWRAAPPKMSWVPGYWAPTAGGWQWISGYWAPAGVQNIEYLPPPPAIEDLEPVTVQPSPDMIWVPPCMYWNHGQYIRRSGYWLTAQPSWVWIPAHYVMTPRGYIFAAGHWDYALERRGVLFAPVYFPASVYHRVAFTYSPSIVVDVGLLQVSLFAYPRYHHYYFGDYYDDAYLRIGIFPWFESRHHHIWYDPVYEHSRWRHHRSEPRWEEHERDEYRRRCDDKNLRPAHTFREQESRLEKMPEPQRHTFQVTQPIETAAARKTTAIKFERIGNDARQKISRQATEVHTFSDKRTRWESPAAGSKTAQPDRENKPAATPITGHRQIIQPTVERKPEASPEPMRRTTVQPETEHKRTVQPPAKRTPAAIPSTEFKQTVQPAKTSGTAMQDTHKESGSNPFRETQTHQSERIQVPASPVTGGKQGLFHRGPPTQPSAEGSRGHTDSDRRHE